MTHSIDHVLSALQAAWKPRAGMTLGELLLTIAGEDASALLHVRNDELASALCRLGPDDLVQPDTGLLKHALDLKKGRVAELRKELAAFAAQHGGRFLLYGSAVRGRLTLRSDIDIIVDFPAELERLRPAEFAEEACFRHRLQPDIVPMQWLKQDSIARLSSYWEDA